MNTPPFLLAAAALFWASQTGHWPVAIAAAVLMEGPRYINTRWSPQEADFNRVADFCTVLLAGLALYFYFTFGNPRAITLLFQWMPVVLCPIALAVAWSTRGEIDLSVIFWSLRRAPMRRRTLFNPGYSLFVLWLLAASAANRDGMVFQAGLVLLAGWALWPARPRSHPLTVWVLSLAVAAGLGYAGHVGLRTLQQWLEGAAPEWIAGSGSRTDPYRNTTDIGTMGDLKLTEGIVLRVDADSAWRTPILLHRASYDDYRAGAWIARNRHFQSIAPVEVATRWDLNRAELKNADPDQALPGVRLTVHDHAAGANPILSLPIGTARVEALAASDLKANPLGAVQAEHKPGYFSYVAVVGSQAALVAGAPYASPGDVDLKIPRTEAAAIARIADELELGTMPPPQALAAVTKFFADRFQYSLWLGKPAGGATPLADFLLVTRAGHCEYFATATTLLLRAAGIPARYATGFSVQEPASVGEGYVVRERHAHAWVRAWIDGAWRDVDTTPRDWFSAESARAPVWAPLADLWSWLRFQIAQRSASTDRGTILVSLLIPLALWVAWRIRRARRALAPEQAPAGSEAPAARGADSEFYQVERRLTEMGFARRDAEALQEWLGRVTPLPGAEALERDELAALVRLHYRHRFDPEGLPADERERLRDRAAQWLTRHSV